MALVLDWDPLLQSGRLSCSYSSGQVALLRADEGATGLVEEARWQAHSLEAWCCGFDRHQAEVVYSGGDDCCFHVWDLRQGTEQPAFSSRKAHGAGVCCVTPSPHRPGLLATGSYDDHIRVGHQPMEAASSAFAFSPCSVVLACAGDAQSGSRHLVRPVAPLRPCSYIPASLPACRCGMYGTRPSLSAPASWPRAAGFGG